MDTLCFLFFNLILISTNKFPRGWGAGVGFWLKLESTRKERAKLISFYLLQNAGAVIGKGGKNIKALRTDVSIKEFKLHKQLQFVEI